MDWLAGIAFGLALVGLLVTQLSSKPIVYLANTANLTDAVQKLWKIPLPGLKGKSMASTDLVQVSQTDLNNFAAEILAAVAVLKTYVEQLLANQATPLPAADEQGLEAAIASLEGLEPPAPVTTSSVGSTGSTSSTGSTGSSAGPVDALSWV